MAIRQATTITTFDLRLSEPLDLHTLHASLLSLELNPTTGMDHLAVGLRAVGFGDSRWFSVTLEQAGEQHVLSWDGKEIRRTHTTVRRLFPRSNLRIQVDFPKNDPLVYFMGQSRMKGRAADEYLEVTRRGYTCAYPITYDGRLISGIAAVPKPGSPNNVDNLSQAWWPATSEEIALRMPDELYRSLFKSGLRSLKMGPDFRFLWGDTQARRLEGLLSVKLSWKRDDPADRNSSLRFLPAPSTLVWVRAGVISERWESKDFDCPFSFELYLSADDLPTDISGLTLSDSAQRRQRVAEGLKLLHGFLPTLEKQLVEYVSRSKWTIKTLGVLALASVPLTGGATLPLLLGAVGAVFGRDSTKEALTDYLTVLKEWRSRIESLEFLPVDTLGEG